MHEHTGLTAALLLLALSIRALMPAGYMPVVGEHRIAITICTGMGPVESTMAVPMRPGHEAPDHPATAPCVFAGLSAPAVDAPLPSVPTASSTVLTDRRAPASARGSPPFTSPHLRPPSQGPPLTA